MCYVCESTCGWSPEVDYGCLPWLHTTLCVEAGSLSEPIALTSQFSPEIFNLHFSHQFTSSHHTLPPFTWVLGIRAPVLTCTVGILPVELSLQSWKAFWQYLKMLTIVLPYDDTAISVKGTYPRERKTRLQKIVPKYLQQYYNRKKNPKYIPTNEWIKTKGSTNYTIVY